MAADTASSASGTLEKKIWQDTFESAVYDRQWFLKRTTKRDRGFSQLTIRKIASATGQTIATTSDGDTGISFDSMAATPVTMTPAWYLCAHAYSDAAAWISADDSVIDRGAADNVERALAAYIETQYLADVASGTNFLGNAAYDVDAAGLRAAVATLMNNAPSLGYPEDAQIYGLFPALQHDDAMSIPELTHADQRGDGQNPLVSGVIGKGNAIEFGFSTLHASDANGKHSPIWIKTAFGYFYNKTPGGETQRYKKQTRVFADAHFGHNIVFNPRFVDIRTKAA